MHFTRFNRDKNLHGLKPQVDSLLFAAMLLLLQPIQIEEVDPVFQIGGLSKTMAIGFHCEFVLGDSSNLNGNYSVSVIISRLALI